MRQEVGIGNETGGGDWERDRRWRLGMRQRVKEMETGSKAS